MVEKILFSNIGYARGIDGSLRQHVTRFGRNFYCALPVQEQVLSQVKDIIKAENPDICCFVEIDQGSIHSARFNQIRALMDDEYIHHDIADKYGERSLLGRMPLHRGKSNAFLSKQDLDYQKLYFSHGSKRLIYHLALPGDIDLFFAHFSLQKKTRARQMEEVRKLAEGKPRVIILADFNIFGGFDELKPLLHDTDLQVLNREDEHTFQFHKTRKTLDLCICSKDLVPRTMLRVIPQPFSDHAALLLEIEE